MTKNKYKYNRTKHGLNGALLLLCFCFILMFPTSCAKEKEELAPIEDGLYLNYRYTVYGPGVNQWVIFSVTFVQADEEHFWMEIAPVDSSDRPPGAATKRRESVLVDKYFKTERGDFYNLDPPGQIWIPSYKRKKGATVQERKIRKIETWDKWDAYVLSEGSIGATLKWYYDTTTGFLVGSHMSSMGAGVSSILIETNVPGLLPSGE